MRNIPDTLLFMALKRRAYEQRQRPVESVATMTPEQLQAGTVADALPPEALPRNTMNTAKVRCRVVSIYDGTPSNGAIDIDDAMKVLTEKQRLVVEHYYGLDGDCSKLTLGQIGKVLDIKAERVRQIKERSLRKLRARIRLLQALST